MHVLDFVEKKARGRDRVLKLHVLNEYAERKAWGSVRTTERSTVGHVKRVSPVPYC